MTTGKRTKGFETPNHPFQGARIANEHRILAEYGLRSKQELWTAESRLRDIRREARELLGDAQGDADVAAEVGAEFMASLQRKGYLAPEASLDDVLSLELTDILERRLQTQVYRAGLANTVDQARQFIVHGHVAVGAARVTRPGYVVAVDEEDRLGFYEYSPLADELHPERAGGQ
ncbi:MAG: 30S ribosomal protein S4 [Halobacteriales archaeon]